MSDPRWTQPLIDKLTTLYLDGQSGSQIASALGLGFTRNAIIGKIHRLGLSRSPDRAAKLARTREQFLAARRARAVEREEKRATREQAKAATPAPRPKPKPRIDLKVIPATALRLMDRRRFQCAFPVGTPDRPGNQLCCGARVVEGRPTSTESYCEAHAAVVLNDRQPKHKHMPFVVQLASHSSIDHDKKRAHKPLPSTVWDEGRAA